MNAKHIPIQKPKVAFFDFACCEGCQLQVANLEEDVIGLTKLVDIVEFREVLTSDQSTSQYDIAFIEGSITRKADEERLKDIRNRSKLLVAYGQCAVSGGVNRIKNQWHSMEDVKHASPGYLPHQRGG
jgi:sulfhydrogenase subunit delta